MKISLIWNFSIKNNKLFLIGFPLLCLTIAFSNLAVTAELYKWTDEKGQVHYTKEPPPNWTPAIGAHKKSHTVETLDTEELKKRNVIPSLGSNRAASKENESQEQPQEERKSPSSLDDATAARMNCELARRNAQILQSNAPVFVRDKQGNKVILDTHQRKTALAKVQKDIARSCEPIPLSRELATSNIAPAVSADSKPAEKEAAKIQKPLIASSISASPKTEVTNNNSNSNIAPAVSAVSAVSTDSKPAEKEAATIQKPLVASSTSTSLKTEVTDNSSKTTKPKVTEKSEINILLIIICFILSIWIKTKLPSGLRDNLLFFIINLIFPGDLQVFLRFKLISIIMTIIVNIILISLICFGLYSGVSYLFHVQ